MPQFQGVIVYEIIRNEDMLILNGVYANKDNGGSHDGPYEVNNEIAKRDTSKDMRETIEGDYDVRYIAAKLEYAILEIRKSGECYRLEWFNVNNNKKGKMIFQGIGMKCEPDHLAVSYVGV